MWLLAWSRQPQPGEPVSVHQRQRQPAQLESGDHRGAFRSDGGLGLARPGHQLAGGGGSRMSPGGK